MTQGFVGADPDVEPSAKRPTDAVVSYFKGSPSQWRAGLPTYASVVYRDIWEGIDLVYEGGGGQLKYSFFLEPGANPDNIRLTYRGATGFRRTRQGQLDVTVPGGGFREDVPYAYQDVGGRRVTVPVSYAVDPRRGGVTGPGEYGFRLGNFDDTRPLVIDPVMLIYAGYIGGSGVEDVGRGIAVDGAGNAYIVGTASSDEATFPDGDGFGSVPGPDQSFNGSSSDVFVAKVNPTGTALVYAGYIGGSGEDQGRDIAVDAVGNAYVTGFTDSTEAGFPDGDGFGTIGGPDLTYNGGFFDGFVAKVNAAGTALDYAGYIGGSDSDDGLDIAVDGTGNAYVAGTTQSAHTSFPDGDGFGTLGGPDVTHNGLRDAYVAKVSPTGAALVYAGYIGGSGDDVGSGVDVDASGNAYVTGSTDSTQTTFPDGDGFGAVGGPDVTHNGSTDAFVAKVNAGGSGLVYAGYLGGTGSDGASAVAVNGAGNAYLAGGTASPETSFPDGDGLGTLPGPDATYNGGSDAFVAKVNAAGSGVIYAGYIGGSALDSGLGVTIDGAGNAYVTGYTASTEATFPDGDGFGSLGGPDLTYNGAFQDAFVAAVNSDGTALRWAGYIGGDAEDMGSDIAVGDDGSIYITGHTESTETTFPDGDGFGSLPGIDQTHNGGDFDGFVAKLADVPPSSPSVQSCAGSTATIVGTSAGETIIGTFGPDVIVALGGDDVIDGGGGDDVVCAGEGNDSVTGGAGNDTIDGEGGTDRLIESGDVDFMLTNTSLMGLGTDTLAGIEAAILTGGPGETLIDASAFTGPVVIAGGEGDDVLIGGPSNDSIDGGGGHLDVVFVAGDVNFTLTNTSLIGVGTDALTGIERVFLSGGPSGRVIDASGFTGSVFVAAGGGADRVIGGRGRDILYGEGGKDRLAGRGGRDVLIGGPQADRLSGGAGADRLAGRRGNDRLLGGSGNDRLDGGKGTDVCIGGPGKDTLKACELVQ